MLGRGTDLPKTSQASPGDFKDVYDELGADADGIVSIHVSAKISGTCNSAIQAAELTSATCPIEVVDSAQGLDGARAGGRGGRRGRQPGRRPRRGRGGCPRRRGRAQCFCLFETLEYLEKGGRIGKAQAMIGSVLKIKPMIIIQDGEVTPLGKAARSQRRWSR